MPGTEELMARLQQLENGYYGDKEAARQKQFMDTYGSRFSNNHSIGMAILNELDARGVDTSAADEAVQEILDQLRTDCQDILDKLSDTQRAAVENAKKIEQVADVISNAVANNPDAAMPGANAPEVESAEMPPEMLDAEELNMEGIGEPEGDAPVEASEQPEQAETTPEEQEPANPEENPEQITSDIRTKRIERMKSHWGKTNTQKKKDKEEEASVVSDINAKNIFRPAAFMINAARGGR